MEVSIILIFFNFMSNFYFYPFQKPTWEHFYIIRWLKDIIEKIPCNSYYYDYDYDCALSSSNSNFLIVNFLFIICRS
jgi:hypothetical protein